MHCNYVAFPSTSLTAPLPDCYEKKLTNGSHSERGRPLIKSYAIWPFDQGLTTAWAWWVELVNVMLERMDDSYMLIIVPRIHGRIVSFSLRVFELIES